MTIRALVFDWGGVIQRTVDPTPRRALERELGLAPGAVDRAVFESEAWNLACTGRCSGNEAWTRIAAGLGIAAEGVPAFVRRFFAGDRRDERLVSLIGDLRGRGVSVGLLSNAPAPRSPDDIPVARWGDPALFDAQVFSYQLGALKPDPATYQAAQSALGVHPSEALFVDDAPANVQGAWAEGMAAILFGDTDSLLRALARLGFPL